ncbi:unnamed protein product [Sphagnum jensenii]|uniref:Uncharacterized protein n=1 Tax=Sphagnum jensenii TaxID=128206 RepID=A0ABP0XBQ3_9BRYO
MHAVGSFSDIVVSFSRRIILEENTFPCLIFRKLRQWMRRQNLQHCSCDAPLMSFSLKTLPGISEKKLGAS